MNVLVGPEGQPLLADFGLSRFYSDLFHPIQRGMQYGNARWLAPELCVIDTADAHKPTTKSDMWAFGMFMLELYTEEPPWSDCVAEGRVYIRMYLGEVPDRPRGAHLKATCLEDEVWRCMQDCWAMPEGMRPSAKSIVQRLQHALNGLE